MAIKQPILKKVRRLVNGQTNNIATKRDCLDHFGLVLVQEGAVQLYHTEVIFNPYLNGFVLVQVGIGAPKENQLCCSGQTRTTKSGGRGSIYSTNDTSLLTSRS